MEFFSFFHTSDHKFDIEYINVDIDMATNYINDIYIQ